MLHSNAIRWIGIVAVVAVVSVGCESTDSDTGETTQTEATALCAEAQTHFQTCTGSPIESTGCDQATAEAALSASCDELQALDAKSDCPWWASWTCWFSGWGDFGGSTSSRGEIVAIVEECAFGGFCDAVISAPCTLVELRDEDGNLLDEQIASDGGYTVFEDLEQDATYTVHAMRADGTPSQERTTLGSDATADAVRTVRLESAEERVYFGLNEGEGDLTRRCADSIEIPFYVLDDKGEDVGGDETEWDWIAVFTAADGEVDYLRAYRFFEQPNNAFGLVNVAGGALGVSIHRVSIPDEASCSWYYIGDELYFGGEGAFNNDECRLPNRNELLLENFEVDDVDPFRFDFEVPNGPGDHTLDAIEITDPTPGL